jgi:hypothetical protein
MPLFDKSTSSLLPTYALATYGLACRSADTATYKSKFIGPSLLLLLLNLKTEI